MNQKYKPYVVGIVVAEAVGAVSGWLIRDGVKAYMPLAKPPLTPPPVVFPIVWGILFFLMGIGIARIYKSPKSEQRSWSIGIYALQLFFNFWWSILFFNMQAFGFAFAWIIALWILILGMILNFKQIDSLAAKLQIPYLLWVTFAAYLNYGVWMLNR